MKTLRVRIETAGMMGLALAALVSGIPGIEIAEEPEAGVTLLADRDWRERLERLRATEGQPRGLVLITDDGAAAAEAVREGILGLLDPDSPEEAPEGLRAAARGERFCSPRLASGLMAAVRDLPPADPPSPGPTAVPALTGRQIEVARLAVEGIPYKQVARRLGLSLRTVQLHMDNARARLGVEGKAGLVQLADVLRLIDDPERSVYQSCTGVRCRV